MRYKRILSIILSVIFVFGAATSSLSVYAKTYTQADINRLKEKNAEAQKQIDSLANEKQKTDEYITALDKKIQVIQDQIKALESQRSDLESSIKDIEAKIADTEAEMQRIRDEIEAKQKEYDKIFNEYCQRLRAMYVSGQASNLEVLLTCSDISSILTRSEMIKSVSRKDSKTLNELTKKMEEISKDKASLERKKLELNEDKEKLDSQKSELDKNIKDVNSSKSELDAEMAKANAAMRDIKDSISEYQETIDNNSEEMQRISRKIRQSSSSGNGAFSGSMRYPTDSTTISAGYPTYSSGRWHGGVDFPVPPGSNVYAAASGTVTVAMNLETSYGHYLVIDHGNGLSTLYGHNTTLYVGVGDHVNKGQVIASSGSTGNSTGPHCHFEVRINGNQVNPMNYL
ncbi:peptidoglycan DD-metalloendopeptidase family protein [uncultured Eubacterium sp.]|uniref:murein hydrolase activator EnvC family protein n=1 Tax=uncultured Eubacterium sp. TaxID=165185 RepID=UPI0015B220D7|nr:peptidoglycan DD-metalloendopeptidase family protein [uncultured Eubacterium sp.]